MQLQVAHRKQFWWKVFPLNCNMFSLYDKFLLHLLQVISGIAFVGGADDDDDELEVEDDEEEEEEVDEAEEEGGGVDEFRGKFGFSNSEIRDPATSNNVNNNITIVITNQSKY